MYPKANKYLIFFEHDNGVIIYNKQTKKSYDVGTFEYKVLCDLDGSNSVEDLLIFHGLSKELFLELLSLFDKYQLLQENELRVSSNKKWFKKRTLKYNIKSPAIFNTSLGKIFLDVLYCVSIPLLIVSIVLSHGDINTDYILDSVNFFHLVIMDIFLVASISFHEIAHGVFANKNGAFCAEIGIMFDLLLPGAYTTICGINKIKNKHKKIQIHLAGISINAFIAAIALLVMKLPSFTNNVYLFMLFATNLCLILGNSITLVKSDVYYAISCFLSETNLKKDALKALSNKSKMSAGKFFYLLFSFIIEPLLFLALLIVAITKI